jgi:hypothetical protein
MWNSRSPGVEGARCSGPTSSRKGCSSAGRGPLNMRSHACEPMPTTQLSLSFGTLNPTARSSAGRSASSSRTTGSAPMSTVTTRKIAALVSGLSTSCGTTCLAGSAIGHAPSSSHSRSATVTTASLGAASQLSRFSLRQPPARLLAIICSNMAVRAGALMVSPWLTATVRAVLFSWPPVMIPSGSGTMAPS